jgi:hypothetical protein
MHTFSGVSLYTAGTHTITVQDSGVSSISGDATINVLPASANSLLVAAPSTAIAGSSFDVLITALDPYDNTDPNYTGSVTLFSSDRSPRPSFYTFTPGDNGTHTFGGVMLYTAGAQTLTARDAINGSIAGTALVTVSPASADHFLITAPPTTVSGVPFYALITALDPYGNTDTNYQGTVAFTSSDPDTGMMLPAMYTFTTGGGGDSGVHAFLAVTLITPGDQTLTITDTANSSISANATITVTSPAAPPGRRANGPQTPTMSAGQTDHQVALLDQLFAVTRCRHKGLADDLFGEELH